MARCFHFLNYDPSHADYVCATTRCSFLCKLFLSLDPLVIPLVKVSDN